MGVLVDVLLPLLLVAIFIVPTFYGLWRAARTERWGWFAAIFAGWVIAGGWIVGLVFLFGEDRRYRKQVAAAMRGEGYHPDYRSMGT